MPKEYKECVKSEVSSGKDMKTAQRICAIRYYKNHGKRPQDVEASLTPYESGLFDAIEVVEDAFGAKWSYKQRTTLPKGAYLFTDKNGNGHLPYKNSKGEIDCAHLRNAISRLGQGKTGQDWGLSGSSKSALQAKARRLLAKNCGGK